MLRILELGNYVVPAYAGMILAEQGHEVVKWTNGRDPLLKLHRGDELWAWINQGKTLKPRDAQWLAHTLARWAERDAVFDAVLNVRRMTPDIIIDNFLPGTLARWGIDPAALAEQYGIVWVSMRGEDGARSFDVVAQARAWGDFGEWIECWIGDTSGGLWVAFKALAMHARGKSGHFVLGQASCLAKLVEGELVIDEPRWRHGGNPFEVETYRMDDAGAEVEFKGETVREPRRDRAWRLANLWHENGRIKI